MQRIQLKRTKGWRQPDSTIRCCRPGKWGNDFKVGECVHFKYHGAMKRRSVMRLDNPDDFVCYVQLFRPIPSTDEAIRLYRTYQLPTYTDDDLRELLEYTHLGCWCRIGSPCHVDELIGEIKRRGLG